MPSNLIIITSVYDLQEPIATHTQVDHRTTGMTEH